MIAAEAPSLELTSDRGQFPRCRRHRRLLLPPSEGHAPPTFHHLKRSRGLADSSGANLKSAE